MSLNNKDVNPRRISEDFEEEVLRANDTHQRPQHCHHQGERTAIQLIPVVAQMATNMRSIAV